MNSTQNGLHERLRGVFESAGYRRFKMSKFEEYDLYAKNKDFLVSENVLTFTDLDGRLMALKPDVTLSIVKNSRDSEGIEKVYYHENVYRASGGSLGFREISQAGLECIGEIDEYCVCEVLSLAAKSLMQIRPKYELDVSHLGILCELAERAGLDEAAKKEVLKLFGEKNTGELEKLLNGAEPEAASRLIRLSQMDHEAKAAADELREILEGYVSGDSLELFISTCRFLSEEFGGKVRVDFSAVGDVSYYSGIYFKGYVDGVPASVLSGGQYGGLMKKLKKPSRAIGFAIYLDLVDPLFELKNQNDADVLLIYSGSSAEEIRSAVKTLSEGGKSVLALPQAPKNMRFGGVYKLSGGELCREC